jgi:hypothetical protein
MKGGEPQYGSRGDRLCTPHESVKPIASTRGLEHHLRGQACQHSIGPSKRLSISSERPDVERHDQSVEPVMHASDKLGSLPAAQLSVNDAIRLVRDSVMPHALGLCITRAEPVRGYLSLHPGPCWQRMNYDCNPLDAVQTPLEC